MVHMTFGYASHSNWDEASILRERSRTQLMQKLPKDHPRLNVLGKVLAVLEAVTDHPQGVGLPDLAREARPFSSNRASGAWSTAGQRIADARSRARALFVGPRLVRLSLAALPPTTGGPRFERPCRRSSMKRRDVQHRGARRAGLRVCRAHPVRMAAAASSRGRQPLARPLPVGRQGIAGAPRAEAVRAVAQKPQACRENAAIDHEPGDSGSGVRADSRPRLCPEQRGEFRGDRGCGSAHQRRRRQVVAALTMHGPLPRLSIERCEAQVPRMRQAAQRIARGWGLT